MRANTLCCYLCSSGARCCKFNFDSRKSKPALPGLQDSLEINILKEWVDGRDIHRSMRDQYTCQLLSRRMQAAFGPVLYCEDLGPSTGGALTCLRWHIRTQFMRCFVCRPEKNSRACPGLVRPEISAHPSHGCIAHERCRTRLFSVC